MGRLDRRGCATVETVGAPPPSALQWGREGAGGHAERTPTARTEVDRSALALGCDARDDVRSGEDAVADVARLTCSVVDRKMDEWDDVLAGVRRVRASEGLVDPMPPITVLGVQALFRPEILVEIEAIAVVP